MLNMHVNHVEVLIGCPINFLCSDGSGVYNNKAVKEICNCCGIHHEMTNVYTPQENGIAEQMNRTIKEMALCMLVELGLPKTNWAKVCKYVAPIINRTPTSALNSDITPHRAFTGIKPSVAHIRPFGCKAHVHIPKKKCTKFNAKSLECVLLGYCEHKRTYRLLHKPTGRIIKSRDVVFDEGNLDGVPTQIVITTEPVFPSETNRDHSSPHPTIELPDSDDIPRPSRHVTVEEVPDEGNAPAPVQAAVEDVKFELDAPPPPQAPQAPAAHVPGPYLQPIPAPEVRCSGHTQTATKPFILSELQPPSKHYCSHQTGGTARC